jgi:hypothetical protein
VTVALTGEGRRLTEELGAEVGRRIAELTDGLGEPGRTRLARLATRVVVDAAARAS